jgi:hypothetical protein
LIHNPKSTVFLSVVDDCLFYGVGGMYDPGVVLGS